MFGLDQPAGFHIYNYADKPDLTTAQLVDIARNAFGRNGNGKFHIPYGIGLCAGYVFDLFSQISRKNLPISAIRIRKFCADTTISTGHLMKTGFERPYSLKQALEQTIEGEFLTDKGNQ